MITVILHYGPVWDSVGFRLEENSRYRVAPHFLRVHAPVGLLSIE
jgi:hypothetical protein